MDRTERLLDLVALLLDAREPISWAELRESFPEDYGKGSDEAAERKFERDKAELLELGIPISYVQGDDDRRDGYVVDRESYYLPELNLRPDELAVLYAAGSAALASGAFPGKEDLAHALRKVGFLAGTELPTPKVRLDLRPPKDGQKMAESLGLLWSAASSRKWVQISYYSPRGNEVTDRKVDPYGLGLRQGIWSLVGHCHLRQAVRTFHVHRIRDLSVNPHKPRSADFEVPPEFRLDAYLASHPWQHRFHAPLTVELSLRGELKSLAARAFPAEEVITQEDEARVRVRTTALDGLCRYVLAMGPQARVVGPPEAISLHRAMAEKVLAAHQGGGDR